MNLSKLKSTARAFTIIAGIILLAFILYGGFSLFKVSLSSTADVLQLISNLLLLLISVIIMINVILLLHNISSYETPFTVKNVSKLKWISIFLIAFEPISMLMQFIINKAILLTNSGNVAAISFASFGGMIFVTGLAALGLTMVFRYGVELQKQSDETL